MGRPSLLAANPQLGEELAAAVERGSPLEVAAAAAGLDPAIVHSWVARGKRREGSQLFADFADRIAQARARYVQARIDNLNRAAEGGALVKRKTTTVEAELRDGRIERTTTVDETFTGPDWRADAWMLARADPDRFAERATKVEVSGPDGGPIKSEHGWGEVMRNDPEARRMARELGDRLLGAGAPRREDETIEGEGEVIEP